MSTNYAGINYAGPGQTTNMDAKTGIRYGVIPQHAVNHDAIDDVFQNGLDLGFEAYKDQCKANIREALSDFFSDFTWGGKTESRLDSAVSDAFEAVSDGLGDMYENNDGCAQMLYESDGLKIQTDSGGDLWILASPFFTYAQFCSPCAPGACYLKNALETPSDSNRAYCLPADWFDDESPCPYPVYSVATGELVTIDEEGA